MMHTETFNNRQVSEGLTLAGLRHHVRWCAWHTIMRKLKDGTETAVKMPVGRNQLAFKSNDPSTWMTYADACKVLNVLPKSLGKSGVGIVVGAIEGEAVGWTLIGFDLDSCLGDDGVQDWATDILGCLGEVYTEISPGGHGVKVFTLMHNSELPAFKAALDIPRWKREWKFPRTSRTGLSHAAGIEVHTGHHFFTVTGQGHEQLGVLKGDRVGVLAERLTHWFGDGSGGRVRGAGGDVEVTDEMIRSIVLPDDRGELEAAEEALLGRSPRLRALWAQTFALGDDKSASALAFHVAREIHKAGIDDSRVGVGLMLKHEAVWDWFLEKGDWDGRRQIARAWFRAGASVRDGVAGNLLASMPLPKAHGMVEASGSSAGAVGDSGAVVALRYDAPTIRRLIDTAPAEEVARLFADLVINARLDPLEQEELLRVVAVKAGLPKGLIKQQVKETLRAARVAQRDQGSDWQIRIQRSENGDAFGNLANAILYLRCAPELKGMVGYDRMMRGVYLNYRVQGSLLGAPGGTLQDNDVSEIQEWMQQNGLTLIGREIVQQAVNMVAQEHAYHPVQDYLNRLVWDGKPRLDTWLKVYLGASQTDNYLKVIGRCFILAMVNRIMRPGCQCDYMLVLEGPQGALKTTACNVLAGDWFSNSLPDLHSMDDVRLAMHMRGKWLIEIGELASFKRSDMDKLKNFLTRREETYTPKFGRNEVTEPRQCVYIGTTNEENYLKDSTGSRRQWPVKVGNIDVNKLKADRNQLFAEAMQAFKLGEQYWPTKETEVTYIKSEQEDRFEADPWEDDISAWVINPAMNFATQKPYAVTTRNIAESALKIVVARYDMIAQKRIANVMRRLGWRQRPSTREWVKG